MNLVDEATHRLLAYVDAVRSRGHRLTESEFNEFAARPERKSETLGVAALALNLAKWHEGRRWTESTSAWFVRLGWARLEGRQPHREISLTSLGRALLRHLDAPPPVQLENAAIEVFLDPEDPMNYIRLIGTLSSLGEEVFLIDPYFRYEQLIDVSGTTIKRVLTSKKIKDAAVAQLGLTLGALSIDQRPEIRLVADLHDRFAISETGRVIAIGSSIGSSRKNPGAVVEFHREAGEAIKLAHEKLWDDAEAISPKQIEDNDVD